VLKVADKYRQNPAFLLDKCCCAPQKVRAIGNRVTVTFCKRAILSVHVALIRFRCRGTLLSDVVCGRVRPGPTRFPRGAFAQCSGGRKPLHSLNRDQGLFKIDHRFSDANNFSVSYFTERATDTAPFSFSGPTVPGFGELDFITFHNVALHDTHTSAESGQRGAGII
jgi:hypothetical protein